MKIIQYGKMVSLVIYWARTNHTLQGAREVRQQEGEKRVLYSVCPAIFGSAAKVSVEIRNDGVLLYSSSSSEKEEAGQLKQRQQRRRG